MKQFYCSVFGHDFVVTKQVTHYVKEYSCARCKMQITNNGQGGYTKLTAKYREINSVLERIHKKRLNKRKAKTTTIVQKEHSILAPLIEFDFPHV